MQYFNIGNMSMKQHILEQPWKIKRHNLCMHITAMKILGKFLFVAEGNQVSIFNLNSKKIFKSDIIFSNSSIHGIRTDGRCSNVLFFGSKSLRHYSFDSTPTVCLKSCSEEILLPDWIFDVQWLYYINRELKEVAVITAHNCITIFTINSKERLKTIQCAENCILYSASILSTHKNVIVVAVGTVFKQILLWSPNSANEIKKAKVPFHCLEGHKGVIYSVSYSKYHKLLSSTSDDRSIRLWKVNSSSNDDTSLEFWEKSDICPIHILYAHESRVWNSVILENCILSVGEDSCICFWDMDGKLLRRKKSHKGGSIWCLETNNSVQDCSETNSYTAFTGGSDGGVYCWEVPSIQSAELISQISLHEDSLENDFPRAVSIVCCDNCIKLMATTDKGCLSFYDMFLKTWKDLYQDANFVSYCNSSISSKSPYIALGNLYGDLVLLNSSESLTAESFFKKFKIHSGKVFSLHWIDVKGKYLLSCGAEGHMILWKVEFQNNEFSVSQIHEFHLPKSKPHWWSTCAVQIDASSIVVGDRGGSISFYCPDTGLDKIFEPNMIHKCIHGKNGVTDIKKHQSLIYSVGRDGRVLVYCIKEKSLDLLHAIKISRELEWIGKIQFYGSDLLLLGFHTTYFIVWSTALESTVMTVECGGGHRSWDFHLDENGQATFTAIKKKDVIFTTENLHFTLNKSVLKAGVSGKEFCQICYLFKSNSSNSGCMAVFAAGGEDNALRIIGFIDDKSKSPEIITLMSVSGHLSSIRSLAKTSMLEEDAYLLVSAGGRAQMMIWKIKNNLKVECEQLSSYIVSTPGRMNRKSSKESQGVQVDPQTRLMDVTVSMNYENHSRENYIIALACSDSYFRVYNFDAMKRLLSLCYNIQMGNHCNLKVSCIQNSLEINRNMFFVIATTSGDLNFVNHEYMKSENAFSTVNCGIKYNHELQFQIHLHQSGINAIDIKHISGKLWLICTGGDDNTLFVVIVQFHSLLKDCEVVAERKLEFAHASQITGIKILQHNMIVTASIDQRINFWSWSFHNRFISIALETSKMSTIPDIANLESWRTGNGRTVMVCGEGIESFSIENLT